MRLSTENNTLLRSKVLFHLPCPLDVERTWKPRPARAACWTWKSPLWPSIIQNKDPVLQADRLAAFRVPGLLLLIVVRMKFHHVIQAAVKNIAWIVLLFDDPLFFLVNILHHIFHPAVEQPAQVVYGVGGHALTALNRIIRCPIKTHLLELIWSNALFTHCTK